VILARYVAVKAVLAFLAALGAVVAIFLVVDYVDNAHVIRGEDALWGGLELYAYKAAMVTVQVAPAALLLGAGIAASGLRQTREWTALRSVGLGPWRLALPMAAATLLLVGGLILLQDLVGVHAAERAEEISATKFVRGGAGRRYQAWREPKRWFRGANSRRIYNLRGLAEGGGFASVTVLELSKEFRVARRIDARGMRPAPGGAWTLVDVEDRSFDGDGAATLIRYPSHDYRFDEPPGSFDLAPGRPSQLRFGVLTQQIALRQRLGQPTADFRLERANRLAYPLVSLGGVLLVVALALRRERRGHLSAALLEALGVTMGIWALQGVAWALGLSGQVSPVVAAWAPDLLVFGAGALALRRVS
jgi:lipopolysaccharide export system permease protein